MSIHIIHVHTYNLIFTISYIYYLLKIAQSEEIFTSKISCESDEIKSLENDKKTCLRLN